MFADFRLHPAQRGRQRQYETRPALRFRGEFDDLAERHHLGPDQVVTAPDGRGIVERTDECVDDIADPHRLEARIGAAQRQSRRKSQQLREAAEQAVAGPGDHRRTQQRPVEFRSAHPRFGFAARLEVMALAVARVQRAHLQQSAHADVLHRCERGFGEFDIDLAESAAVVAAFVEDADEIDHDIGAAKGVAQECRLEHIADLDVRARGNARAGVGAARQHAHAVALREQPCDQRATDETAAAEHDDAAVHRWVFRAGAGTGAAAGGGNSGVGQTKVLRVSTMRPARRSVIGIALRLSRQS